MKEIGVWPESRFMIFGAGFYGKIVAEIVGRDHVECFIDNYSFGKTLYGIPILSFKEAIKKSGSCVIIVASILYNTDMVAQLENAGVTNYIVYGQPHILPVYWLRQELHYMDYKEILSLKKINKYSSIAIYGDNPFIFILLEEIKRQCGDNSVIGVIGKENYDGINYISLEEALNEAECLIINVHRNNSDVRYELLKKGYKCELVDIFDIDAEIKEFSHPNIEKYKDIHKGERCFLIGNGPSLRAEDLDTLHEHGEICFACNRINLIFDKTKWRPDYYAISDGTGLIVLIDDIRKVKCPKFIADYYETDRKYEIEADNVEYLHYQFGGLKNHPGFSFDPSKYTCEGGTALYDICLQMAVYMGFSDIYILGVDNTILHEENDHFAENYITDEHKANTEELGKMFVLDGEEEIYNQLNRCFESASIYSQKGKFRIYNATRGGRLEVLPRVDFDSLF